MSSRSKWQWLPSWSPGRLATQRNSTSRQSVSQLLTGTLFLTAKLKSSRLAGLTVALNRQFPQQPGGIKMAKLVLVAKGGVMLDALHLMGKCETNLGGHLSVLHFRNGHRKTAVLQIFQKKHTSVTYTQRGTKRGTHKNSENDNENVKWQDVAGCSLPLQHM